MYPLAARIEFRKPLVVELQVIYVSIVNGAHNDIQWYGLHIAKGFFKLARFDKPIRNTHPLIRKCG